MNRTRPFAINTAGNTLTWWEKSMDEDALMAAAKAMWSEWARIADPAWAEKRWSRMTPAVKERFVIEARGAIGTYLSLVKSNR
jgi:hypothetical protein